MDNTTLAYWQQCLSLIRSKISEPDYTTWFEPLKLYSYEDNMLIVEVPTKFFIELFDKYCAKYLIYAAQQIAKHKVSLQYRVKPQPLGNASNEPIIKIGKSAESKNPYNPTSPQTNLPELDPQLNPHYNFETFIEGESNKLARSVALSIADNPGKSTFNPFFLYGPSGVGKTHLANAIGVSIKEKTPEKRVLFVSAHIFKTQYTDSVIHNTQNDFLNFYQTIDVLIIDDIQEITTAKTQQAFFHIFNHLQQNSRQIVITCDRPPVLLEGLEERMLTRFKWGMTAEIEKPDTKLRRDILISKIRRDGLDLSDDVIQYIAQNVESSVRELEGIVNSLMAYSVVDNCEIDLQLTQRIVARAVNLEKKELTPDNIINVVCQHYGIKQKDIFSKTRKQTIAYPRQIAMYLIHKYTDIVYGQIGHRFGGRDHSTVIYACNQVGHRISVDKKFRREIEDLEKEISAK